MATSLHAASARTAKLEAADAMGISTEFIGEMVERFYARIRQDAVLGPIFADHIGDWAGHLDRMKAFWNSVLRQGGGFSGSPMGKHIAIPLIEQAEFDRWLDLFRQTLADIETDGRATALIAARAQMIADSLLIGIRINRDGNTGS